MSTPRTSRRWHVPREGIYWILAAFGLGFTGWYKNINLILLLAYLMAALFVLNAVVVRLDLRNLRARRLPLGPIFANTPFDWEIELAAERHGPSRTGWKIVDEGPLHSLRWFVTWWDGETLRLREELTLPKRGEYECTPLHAFSRYPFGLVQYDAELGPKESVLVLPQLGQIDGELLRDWLARESRGDGRRHSFVRHVATQEAEIHGLRPFRFGDSPRWIHWRTSARRNELMVREFENQPSPDLILVVEPGTMIERHDALMSLAASVCRDWCREANLRFTMIIARPSPIVLMGRTRAEAAIGWMEPLAREQGGVSISGAEVMEHFPGAWQSTPVLVLTAHPQSTLVAQLEQRTGRPVPSVRVDELPEWYSPPVNEDFQ